MSPCESDVHGICETLIHQFNLPYLPYQLNLDGPSRGLEIPNLSSTLWSDEVVNRNDSSGAFEIPNLPSTRWSDEVVNRDDPGSLD